MVVLYIVVGVVLAISLVVNTIDFHKRYGLKIPQAIIVGVLSIPAMALSLVQQVLILLEYIVTSMALILGGTSRAEMSDKLVVTQMKKIMEQIGGDKSPEEYKFDDEDED